MLGYITVWGTSRCLFGPLYQHLQGGSGSHCVRWEDRTQRDGAHWSAVSHRLESLSAVNCCLPHCWIHIISSWPSREKMATLAATVIKNGPERKLNGWVDFSWDKRSVFMRGFHVSSLPQCCCCLLLRSRNEVQDSVYMWFPRWFQCTAMFSKHMFSSQTLKPLPSP